MFTSLNTAQTMLFKNQDGNCVSNNDFRKVVQKTKSVHRYGAE